MTWDVCKVWQSNLMMAIVLAVMGCGNINFQAAKNQCLDTPNADIGALCKVNADGSQSYDYTISTGEVDILFVDDNSGSMYSEQVKMANQFPGFLDMLSNLDYQIAITTTDVENRGVGRDGAFLEFSPGQAILKNNSRSKDSTHYQNISLFQSTIKRPETLLCPDQPGCPSGDERGIYALIRSMQRSENRTFFRNSGHLAVVILSDEDERSSGGGLPGSGVNGGAISSKYVAEEMDKPESFVLASRDTLPQNKSLSVHSIIIQPAANGKSADTQCWSQQNNQGEYIKGFYGTQYSLLSFPSQALKGMGRILKGTAGSICSSNYTREMGDIAQHILERDLQLPCRPVDGTLKVDLVPKPSSQPNYFVDDSNQLVFQPALSAGTKVHLQFNCPPN